MANRTKSLLAEAFKELLSKKPLDKITVKELVEQCGINRQTFYYNFHDIYDLAEWIFSEDAKRLIGTNTGREKWKDGILAVFDYLQENPDITLNAFHSMSRASIRACVKTVFYPLMETIIDEQSKNKRMDEEDKEFLIQAYVLLLTGIVIEWLESGMCGDYMAQLSRLERLVNCSIPYLVQEFSDY